MDLMMLMGPIDWSLLIFVVLLNAPFALIQFILQEIQRKKEPGFIFPRRVKIPGTTGQKFLHWQDFLTQTWGDFIFLPLVAFGFFSCSLNAWEVYTFLAVAMVAIPIMIGLCTSQNHKPDWGFPGGKAISWGGAVHIPYFAIYSAISVICIIKIIEGQLTNWPLVIALIGSIGWIAMELGDYLLGHFEPLKLKN